MPGVGLREQREFIGLSSGFTRPSYDAAAAADDESHMKLVHHAFDLFDEDHSGFEK